MVPFSGDTDTISRASTGGVTAVPSERKRMGKAKANEFLLKNGKRHHAYEVDKVPYPLSYECDYLDLEALQLVSGSNIGYPLTSVPEINAGNTPTRCLDLGCGQGLWVLAAAKEWTETEFVGFDLVNFQVPLAFVEETVADRITWVHGNFLSNRLPFDDDDFDFVRICSLSRGIPENKWLYVLEEIHRILNPGGVVELMEADIVFPVLPPWFTSALRTRPLRNDSVYFFPADERNPSRLGMVPASESPSPQPSDHDLPHEHALLESLFYSVFETRFINLRPTAIIPSYFTTIFSNVSMPNARLSAMPPFYSPLPSPNPGPQYHRIGAPLFAPYDSSPNVLSPIEPKPAFITETALDTLDSKLSVSSDSALSLAETLAWDTSPMETAGVFSFATSHKMHRAEQDLERDTSPSSTAVNSSTCPTPELSHHSTFVAEDTQCHDIEPEDLLMHLYFTFLDVVACRESMWEELNDCLLRRPETLVLLGWHADEDLDELHDRKKFEKLFDRYCSDMRVRMSYARSLSKAAWPEPFMGPVTKAERLKYDRLNEILQSRSHHSFNQEWEPTCRRSRNMWGHKAPS